MISFIVPVYNVEKYLMRCIESVLHSKTKNYEIVLVDDGSKDNSGKICDNYCAKHENIKVLHKENGGLSDARNCGIKAATGEYLFFLDSDDYLSNGAVQRMNELLLQNANIDILFLNIKVVESDGHNSIWRKGGVIPGILYSGSEFLKAELSSGKYKAMAPNGLYKRSFIVENDLFFKKGILHEDEQWSPRVVVTANSVIAVNEAYYVYKIREGSITTKKDKTKNALDIMDTCVELKTFFRKINDKELKKLENRYLAKLYVGAVVIGIYCGDKIRVLEKNKSSIVEGCGMTFADTLRFRIFQMSPYLYAFLFRYLYIKK